MSLAPIVDSHQPLQALATEQAPPEMSMDLSEGGRLKVRLRQANALAAGPATKNELCVVKFKALTSGATSIHLENSESLLVNGTRMRSEMVGKSLQIH
jgi:hypothetical protein